MESGNLVSKLEKNQIKTMDIFNNLKADSFLEKVFDILETKKSLNIVKYNNNIKKKINININDYKEYSEQYPSIEIEIKPFNNKYGNFINIEKEDEECYHIYFNNNEEEIKRNYINKDEQIKIIKIIIDYQIESFEELFQNCYCIESIYFKKFFRNDISNMRFMFYKCSSLKELSLNNFNTDNVTNMNGMFSGCSSLKELSLNNFNTDNVTDMSAMFYGCSKELIMKIQNQYKNIKEEAFKNIY